MRAGNDDTDADDGPELRSHGYRLDVRRVCGVRV